MRGKCYGGYTNSYLGKVDRAWLASSRTRLAVCVAAFEHFACRLSFDVFASQLNNQWLWTRTLCDLFDCFGMVSLHSGRSILHCLQGLQFLQVVWHHLLKQCLTALISSALNIIDIRDWCAMSPRHEYCKEVLRWNPTIFQAPPSFRGTGPHCLNMLDCLTLTSDCGPSRTSGCGRLLSLGEGSESEIT